MNISNIKISSQHIIKGCLSFSNHNSCKLRNLRKKLISIIGYFRTTDPDICIRKELLQFFYDLTDHLDIPYITGKSNCIRSSLIDICKNLSLLIVDRIFCNLNIFCKKRLSLYRIRIQGINPRIRMNIFCI